MLNLNPLKQFSKIAVFIFIFLIFPAITRAETIHSASEIDYPPFSIVTTEGKADGFSVELLSECLKRDGKEVDFYVGPWADIKRDLTDGKIQVLPLVGRTPERENVFDFTVPYISIYGNIFVRTDNPDIINLEDLKEKEVIVMEGDNADEFAIREKISNKLIRTINYEEAFTLLSEGKHDAILTQGIVGNRIIEKLGIKNVVSVSQVDNFKQDFTFAVKEGDEKLLALLNDGLSKIIADGTYDKIYNKWFKKPESEENLSIKLEAEAVANQINNYLIANPEKTIYDLQNDELFKKIAVQKIGKNGYSVVLDVQTGIFYFHPQDKLLNTRAEAIKDELPDWWSIISETLGEKCTESSGQYKWKEDDGQITNKYLYLACIEQMTADNKQLFVAATSYLSESEAIKYLDKYKIGEDFAYAQNTIKQRAFDISKQIEIFIKANPNLTLKELKTNNEFNALAVQTVGHSGYTYLVNHKNGILDFHPDSSIINTSYNDFKQKFPAIWNIINNSIQSKDCEDSDGFYEWEDINGEIRDKYTYHHCIDAVTADGVKFFIGASTYLDEYNSTILPEQQLANSADNKYLIFFITFFILIIIVIFIIILLQYFQILHIKGVFIYILIIGAFALISAFFIFSTNLTTGNLKKLFTHSYIEENYQNIRLEKDKILENLNRLNHELEYLVKLETDPNASSEKIEEHYKAAQNRNDDFVHAVYRIDKDNNMSIIYPDSPDIHDDDLNTETYLAKVKNTMSPIISNVFEASEGFQAISLNYPIIKNGIYDGSVAFIINIKDLLKSANIFNHQPSSQESYLLDANLSIILSNNNELLGKNLKDLNNFKDQNNLISKITEATEAGYQYFEYMDDKLLGIYSPIKIKDNSWYILLSSTEKDINSNLVNSLENTWLYTSVTLFLLAMLCFLTGYILTRSFRLEIKSRTEEIDKNVKQINEQLLREADINAINKKLLEDQKKSKEDLEAKVAELEKFQKITINRELKMIELKKKIH